MHTPDSQFSKMGMDGPAFDKWFEEELKTNTELTRQIHTLTTELHRRLLAGPTR